MANIQRSPKLWREQEQFSVIGSNMTTLIVITALILMLRIPHLHCETIDELLSSATKSADDKRSMIVEDVSSDTVTVELDMKFKRSEWEAMERSSGERHREKRKAIRPGVHTWVDTAVHIDRWTNNEIPYYINEGFSASDRHQIRLAMRHWQDLTCLTFRRKTSTDVNYLDIVGGDGCSSMIGMHSGPQTLTLGTGCRLKHIIIHELGHTIGFLHEHSRPDRDEHVSIFSENIKQGSRNQFHKYRSALVNDYGVAYDYLSIMHYGAYFSSEKGCRTIVTKDPDYQFRIGKSTELSFRDVKLANIMYTCNAPCPNVTCPGEGFQGKDCKCYCKGNPIQECANDSQEVDDNLDDYTLTDSNPECAAWAASGECEMNPRWMIPNCQKSCDTCSYEMTTEGSTMSVAGRARTEPEIATESRNAIFNLENATYHQNSSTLNATHANLSEEQTSEIETGSIEPSSSEPISGTYQSRTSRSTHTSEIFNNSTSQAEISSQRTTTGSILLDAITAVSRT